MLTKLVLSLALLASSTFAFAADPAHRIHIRWPVAWEYLPPIERNSVVYLRARERHANKVKQLLELSVVNVATASSTIDFGAIRDLVERLSYSSQREGCGAKIAVVPFRTAKGYYFCLATQSVLSGDSEGLRQYVQGALLQGGHLINVTLRTNDIRGKAAQDILAAVDHLTVEPASAGVLGAR